MNLKTTLVLLVLAAGAGVFCFVETPVATWLGLTPNAPESTDGGTIEILGYELTPEKLTRIEVQPRTNDRPVILERRRNEWTAPGGWPTRKPEVEELVELISRLRTRYYPIPAADDETRKKYGLDSPAIEVKIETASAKYRLAFSEKAPPGEDVPAVNRLELPTFLRVDDRPELVRLAPGLIATLSRPFDYYLQRRLFTDVERVAKEGFGDSQEKVEQLAAQTLTAEEEKPGEAGKPGESSQPTRSRYTLARNGSDWEVRLADNVRDRVDPEKRKSILQALPDIWAEQFVSHSDKDLSKYGLKEPKRTLKITTANGTTITLLIGDESPTKKFRMVTRPAPPVGGMQEPMTQRIEEHFRYAKLANNDQVFEIKDDKLKDVFVPVADLRDSRVARFETRDATRLELTHGPETIVLAKDKDKDRWRMEKPTSSDAESSKVTDILDKVQFLSARDKDILDKSDPKIDGLDKPQATLAITVEEEIKGDGEKKTKKPPRTLKLTIGKHDADKKKLYVKDDWGRVNVVDDSLQALLSRPATAYRGRRILDFASKDVEGIEVQRDGQKLVGLQQKDGAWKLTAPVAADADSGKAAQLARDLGSLEVVEHVNDHPKPEELDKQYGLAKPALTADIKFTGGKTAETLLVGKMREGKPEYFAKRAADPGVFVIKKEIHDELEHDSLAYRPLQLWQALGDDITTVRIGKEGQDEYRLTRKDHDWQITGPFEATAQASVVQPMTQELAGPRGERCVAHSAKDKELEEYGLAKPHLRTTVTTKEGDMTKDRTLLIGKTADQPAGARYAKLGDGDAVYVVSEKLLTAVDHRALDLLDKKLLAIDAKDIASIKSNAGGTPLKLEHQDKGWRVIESPAGQPFAADELIAAQAANLWTHLNAERFAAYGPKADLSKFGLDKPAWTVTVTATAGGKPAEHTIAVGKPTEDTPGGRYVRLDNGPGVAVLSSASVKDLERTYLDFVDRTLLKFDAASASGLARKHAADALEVVKKEDAWRIIKPADLQADDKTMQGLFDQLANLRAERIVAYPAKALKEYGLDPPTAVVTLRLTAADGKPSEKVLKIGKASGDPKKAQSLPHYAQVEGSPIVAVVPGHIAEQLLAGPIAFRDRNLAHFADADKATLERGPRKATFTKVDGTWKLTAPLEGEAEQNDLDDFINAVARLRADQLVAEKPADLKPYGLDKPTATWRFYAGDKEMLGVVVGGRPEAKGGVPDKRCYAKLTNGDLVFLLDAPTTSRVLAEYRGKSLWPTSLDAAQAEKLRYGGSGTSFSLEKVADGWQAAGKPSLKVNTSAINETLAALAGLKPERYVVDKGADMKLYGLEPPELVIEADAPTGSRTLHVGRAEGDSKRYYARVPGKDRTDVFVIGEADAAKLVRPLTAFTQASVKPTP